MSGQRALEIIWRRKWLALAVLLAFLFISAGVTLLLPKVYQATAIVRVIPSDQAADTYSQLQTSQALAQTYAELLKSPNVYQEAVREENLSVTPQELLGSTTVSYVDGTELVQVQVEAQSPALASSLANAVARTFIDQQSQQGQETLVLADPAPEPTQPVRPSLPLNMALALLLGTAVALGGVLLLDFFSDRIASQEELEKLVGAPVLGTLPRIPTKSKDGKDKRAPFDEAMRILRVNLNFALGSSSGSGVVLFTSSLPGEGKTTVSSSLAESYAHAGYECLIVDADLRKPQIHTHFAVRNLQGFSNLLLEGSRSLRDLITRLKEFPTLAILTSGPLPPNPGDLLSRERTKEVLRAFRKECSTTILDSPPALGLADANVLGSLSDGIVLVVDSGNQLRRRDLVRSVEQIRAGKTRILGVVLNRAPDNNITYYGYE